MKAEGDSQRSTFRRRALVLAALLLIPIVWIVVNQREPRYNGVPVSEYVRTALTNNHFSITLSSRQFAPLDTNVTVAALTKVLEEEDAQWKHWYIKTLPRTPLWLRKRLKPVQFNQNLILSCAATLGSFGPDAKPAVPALIHSFNHGNDFVRWQIASQLSRIGPAAQDAIPVLLDAALDQGKNRGKTTKAAAIRALASIDPGGTNSAQKLPPLCAEADVTVAMAATDALGIMASRSPALIPNLHDALKHSQLPVCIVAARHLKQLNALTLEDFAPFIHRLQSDDASQRALGASVLRFAQMFDFDAVPGLLRAAAETNSVVREAATKSLIHFFNDSNVQLSLRAAALKAVFHYGSPDDTYSTMTNLSKVTPGVIDIVPLLIAGLDNDSERVRGRAAQTLGEIGRHATDALPALRKLYDDAWLNVRQAATNAISAIESDAR